MGDAKLTPEQRWYAEVHFGVAGAGTWVFLNKNFSVGRAVDYLADLGKIQNRNDDKNAPKLQLFDLVIQFFSSENVLFLPFFFQQSSGEQMSNLVLLRDLSSGTMVLLLDTAENVFAK